MPAHRDSSVQRLHSLRASIAVACLALSIGCHESPATHGSRQRLSLELDHVLVVGDQPSAVSAAVTWLQARGLVAVGTPTPWLVPTQEEVADQARVFKAQVIVWVQQSGDLRAPMVAVRGIDVDSKAVLWSGQASATDYRTVPTADRVARLTCHALEAAWGDRATDARRPGFGEDCE